MGLDEEGTLGQLKNHRANLIDPKVGEHRGRIVKTTGDGMLAEFASAVDATRCAVDIQLAMASANLNIAASKRIELRIGIHVGDIISDDGDIFGEGVNIAARLEGLADPGGVCVSARVQEDVEGRLDIVFKDSGEQQLKNIARPVRVYRIQVARSEAPQASAPMLALDRRRRGIAAGLRGHEARSRLQHGLRAGRDLLCGAQDGRLDDRSRQGSG